MLRGRADVWRRDLEPTINSKTLLNIITTGCPVWSDIPHSQLFKPWCHTYQREHTVTEKRTISAWAQEEVAAGNLAEVRRQDLVGISPVFTIPKASGGFRIVHDLKLLNQRCAIKTFKMNSIKTVLA